MTISTKNAGRPCATVVSHEFIDKYMAGANGEYVKVYLYVLRHTGDEITDEKIAEDLEITIGDVSRALAYWNRMGVLDAVDSEEENSQSGASCTEKPDTDRLLNDSEYSEMLYVIQRYLSTIFGQKEHETIAYMYDVMKMPRELIEYLVEICVQKGKTSMKYIESIAQDWHKRGIRTVEQAKEDNALYASETYGVMRAFGINDRQPAAAEKRYIDKWFRKMGFSTEVVIEACERTIKSTAKPSFNYADSILTKWSTAGVRTLADITRLDRQHEEKAKASQAAQQNQATGTYGKNRFNNFEQRGDDLDSMMLDRLGKKIKDR